MEKPQSNGLDHLVAGDDAAGNQGKLFNPFDPERLRLPQDFGAELGVKKLLLTLPVRKPDAQSYFRAHPDERYSLEAAVIELKDDRETYIVEPVLIPDLAGEVKPKKFFLCITRQNVLFLWGVPLASGGKRGGDWASSAMQAAEISKKRWIRLKANMSLGAYEVFEAAENTQLAEPVWPDLPMEELLRIAFKDFYINALDHPVIKRLWGKV